MNSIYTDTALPRGESGLNLSVLTAIKILVEDLSAVTTFNIVVY